MHHNLSMSESNLYCILQTHHRVKNLRILKAVVSFLKMLDGYNSLGFLLKCFADLCWVHITYKSSYFLYQWLDH